MIHSTNEPRDSFAIDRLGVRIFQSRKTMGVAAAADIAESIRVRLRNQDSVSIAFAAAPSQNEVLSTLSTTEDIDWSRIFAFHLDEYVGLSADAPQSFRRYLHEHIFDQVLPGQLYEIRGEQGEPETEAKRYEELLRSFPPEIILLGIGENGHLAFNDPPDARFDEDRWVRAVELSEESRIQQVHDECFSTISDVPRQAITMTIPAIMAADRLHCVVPGGTKTPAVTRALREPISEDVPASVLRRHRGATLYLDSYSAAGLGRT